MQPLETYYVNHAGRGLSPTTGIEPIYLAPLYLQRGHGTGNFLGTLFRFLLIFLFKVGRTVGKIITDIAKNNSTDVRAEDIIETCPQCRHRIHTAINQQIEWPRPETCHARNDEMSGKQKA